MKYITIPEDLTLGQDEKGEPVTQPFQAWLSSSPLNSKAFGASGKTLRQSVAIEARFKDKKPGDTVPLEEEEYTLLSGAVETPEGGFNTPIAKLFLSFMDAVADATDEEAVKD